MLSMIFQKIHFQQRKLTQLQQSNKQLIRNSFNTSMRPNPSLTLFLMFQVWLFK